jgi:deaminated glutathione amidase
MRIGVIQIQSALEPESNLKKVRGYLSQAVEAGARAVFLPEVFYSISDGTQATPYLVEGMDAHYQAIQALARDYQLYILGGTAATRVGDKVMNRCFNFDPTGKDLGHYDKMNLFSCDLSKHPSNTVIDESRVFTHGQEPKMIEFEDFKLGLSVCFDLRFPELFRRYSYAGAEVLSISAAFTVPTGKAHWHTLVRARAIENQCYVVAPAQWGKHNERISTYGHSLVVDPWGEVLVDAGEGEKIVFAELSKDVLQKTRERLNVLRDPRA